MNVHYRKTYRAKRRQRKGAAVTEFALIVPLLALITMGAIDVGQSINVSQVVNDASREGARQASRGDIESVDQVTASVRAFVADAFPNIPRDQLSAAVSVDVHDQGGNAIPSGDLTSVDSGARVVVRVSLPFNVVQLTDFLPGFDKITVQTTTVMRRD